MAHAGCSFVLVLWAPKWFSAPALEMFWKEMVKDEKIKMNMKIHRFNLRPMFGLSCRFCTWPQSQVRSVVPLHSQFLDIQDQTLNFFCPLPLWQCCPTCHFVWLSDQAGWIQNKTLQRVWINVQLKFRVSGLLFSDLCVNVSHADHRWGGNPVYDQLSTCSNGEHPAATHQHPGLLDCAP